MYPIVGIIDLRNQYGFRKQDTFNNLISLLNMTITGVNSSWYSVKFYNGSTNGTVYYTIFVTNDYFYDNELVTAQLFINGQLFDNR